MIATLFSWIYIALTAFCLGFAWREGIKKAFHFQIKRIDSLLALGLMTATVYAQFFSLLYRVGAVANGILLLICIGIVVCFRTSIMAWIQEQRQSASFGKTCLLGVLILLWAYFTSRGIIHYDTDLYHAQSIRWIEEYGVVKGLGNLHVRFGYNSAFFALQALYSFAFLTGQSLHTVNGFLALVLSLRLLDICESWREKKLRLSDYARIAAIYYLVMVCDELVSPASDYAIMMTIFYIVIAWLAQLEREKEQQEENSIIPYALLCVAGVYAVTLKLTAGLILILVLKPAIAFIKKKEWKQIVAFLLMGIVVVLPWLIRNVVITGYLLYPFPALDLFQVDWKIPEAIAAVDAAEIKTWGRALYDASKVNLPITQWFLNWFATTLSGTEKLLILADMACTVIFVVTAIGSLLRRKSQHLDYLLVMAAVVASYLFWQFSAPLIRYGYTHVLLLVTLTLGFFVQHNRFLTRQLATGVYVLVLLLGVWKLRAVGLEGYAMAGQPYYVNQKDYGVYELTQAQLGEETIYLPIEGDRTGYEAFPSVPQLTDDVKLRGDGFEDGFMQ